MKNVKHIGRLRCRGLPRVRQSTTEYTDAQRYRAVRKYGDARSDNYSTDFDNYVDSWLDYLEVVSPADFALIMKE